MQVHQQVEVGRHDPNLDNLCALLTGDSGEVVREISGESGIDERLALSSCPDDVYKQAVAHALS